jgi:hypothetical protein
LNQQFNVPTFIRVFDNQGNNTHFGTDRSALLFSDLSKLPSGVLRFGDELIVEVEVDPCFSDYSVDWMTFKGDKGTGPICRLRLEYIHVGNQLDIRFNLKSKELWHRLSGEADDMLDLRYRVLPPL